MSETEWYAKEDDVGWYVVDDRGIHISGYCLDEPTARLIAAAKETRDALRDCLQALDAANSKLPFADKYASTAARIDAAKEIVRAALAKSRPA